MTFGSGTYGLAIVTCGWLSSVWHRYVVPLRGAPPMTNEGRTASPTGLEVDAEVMARLGRALLAHRGALVGGGPGGGGRAAPPPRRQPLGDHVVVDEPFLELLVVERPGVQASRDCEGEAIQARP